MNDFSSTPILVPEDEADRAREILSKWWADSEARISVYLRGSWWRPVVVPFLVAVAIGVLVGIVTRQVLSGLAVWLVGFLLIIQFVGSRSKRRRS